MVNKLLFIKSLLHSTTLIEENKFFVWVWYVFHLAKMFFLNGRLFFSPFIYLFTSVSYHSIEITGSVKIVSKIR